MSTHQENLAAFRTAKQEFLDRARNATVIDGFVEGILAMDAELVSFNFFHNPFTNNLLVTSLNNGAQCRP